MSIRRFIRRALVVCTTVAALFIGTQTEPAWAGQAQAQPQAQVSQGHVAQAQAGQTGADAASESRLAATAFAIAEAPMIDGLLNEPAWQQAPPLTNFMQAEPFEGQPASEGTEVRILYDDDAIYVGVTLHDSDPSQIVTTDTRRDADLSEMDSFQIVFDTFRDQQNGFVFGTNAQGVQYDAQVRNQGERQQAGTAAGT